MNKFSLEDFKYNYFSQLTKEDQEELIMNVHRYPGRFDNEVHDYVSYIWDRLYEIYNLENVPYEDVLHDLRYSNRKYNHSVHVKPTGFKLYITELHEEIGQGIYDYHSGRNIVTIYYFELLKKLDHRTSNILKQCFMRLFNEKVQVVFL